MKRLSIIICLFLLIPILLSCEEMADDMSDTETFEIRIVEIFDEPQNSRWNDTISACALSSECLSGDSNLPDYVFNHLDLPDIGVFEGAIVSVTVPLERQVPLPMPLDVKSWRLYESLPHTQRNRDSLLD